MERQIILFIKEALLKAPKFVKQLFVSGKAHDDAKKLNIKDPIIVTTVDELYDNVEKGIIIIGKITYKQSKKTLYFPFTYCGSKYISKTGEKTIIIDKTHVKDSNLESIMMFIYHNNVPIDYLAQISI